MGIGPLDQAILMPSPDESGPFGKFYAVPAFCVMNAGQASPQGRGEIRMDRSASDDGVVCLVGWLSPEGDEVMEKMLNPAHRVEIEEMQNDGWMLRTETCGCEGQGVCRLISRVERGKRHRRARRRTNFGFSEMTVRLGKRLCKSARPDDSFRTSRMTAPFADRTRATSVR